MEKSASVVFVFFFFVYVLVLQQKLFEIVSAGRINRDEMKHSKVKNIWATLETV